MATKRKGKGNGASGKAKVKRDPWAGWDVVRDDAGKVISAVQFDGDWPNEEVV